MESVVAEGTGKNAKVEGFRVGGKTGTSEDGVNTNKYVTSFLGVATIYNPEIVMLITLYNPTRRRRTSRRWGSSTSGWTDIWRGVTLPES